MGGATKRSSSNAGLSADPNQLVKKGKGGSKRKVVLTSKDEASMKCPVQNIAPKTDHAMLEPTNHLIETKPHISEPNYLCSSFMLESNPPPIFHDHNFSMTHNFTEPFSYMHHHHHHAPTDLYQHQPVATGLRNAAAGLTSLCQNSDKDYYDTYLMNGIPTSLLAYDWQNRDRMTASKGSIPTMKIAPKQPVPIKQKPWSSIGGTTSQLSLGMYSESMSLMGSAVLRPGLESSMSISGFAPQYSSHSNRGKDPKRAEHIACEHKRRFRIKNELNRLNEMVPGLMGCPKNSQAKILQAAADYMEKVIQENARIKMELAALRTQLSSVEPKDQV